MPITKDRILALINAAEQIETSYTDLATSILSILQHNSNRELSDSEALETIHQLVAGYEVHVTASSKAVLKERLWYNLTHRRAEREAAYQERRRRQAGIQPLQYHITTQRPATAHLTPKAQFIKEMAEFDIPPDKAAALYEDRMAPAEDIPSGVLPAFEPSIEDTEGWALPTSEEEEPPV